MKEKRVIDTALRSACLSKAFRYSVKTAKHIVEIPITIRWFHSVFSELNVVI